MFPSCLFAYSTLCRLFSYSTCFQLPQQKYLVSPASRYSHQSLSLWMLPKESVPLSCLFLRLWFTSPLFTGFSVLFLIGAHLPSCSHGTLCRRHLSCRRHQWLFTYPFLLSSKFLEDQGHGTFIFKILRAEHKTYYIMVIEKKIYIYLMNEYICYWLASRREHSLIWYLEKSLFIDLSNVSVGWSVNLSIYLLVCARMIESYVWMLFKLAEVCKFSNKYSLYPVLILGFWMKNLVLIFVIFLISRAGKSWQLFKWELNRTLWSACSFFFAARI